MANQLEAKLYLFKEFTEDDYDVLYIPKETFKLEENPFCFFKVNDSILYIGCNFQVAVFNLSKKIVSH